METIMLNQRLKYTVIASFMIFVNQAQAVPLASNGALYLNAKFISNAGEPETKSAMMTHGVEGLFSIESNVEQGASVVFEDADSWGFDFAAPTYDSVTNINTSNGTRLKAELYNHAGDFPFNLPTRPGMRFSDNGWWYWNDYYRNPDAWFDVVAIEYGADNEVLSLAVDFLLFDENLDVGETSIFGSLRINSDIALNYSGQALSQVPVPMAIWLFGSGLITLVGISKRK